MLTIEELQDMKHADIMQADREKLVDISEIHIDSRKTVNGRILEYLDQVRNPFLVKAGDYILKFQYADCNKTMDERMTEYITKMAQVRYETDGL